MSIHRVERNGAVGDKAEGGTEAKPVFFERRCEKFGGGAGGGGALDAAAGRPSRN